MMEKAIVADKKNPLPMYQKANILVSLEDLDGALEVLEELKQYAPKESSVYALMGKIYKHRLMYDHAMLHFGLALDLKPTAMDVATIKVTRFFYFVNVSHDTIYVCLLKLKCDLQYFRLTLLYCLFSDRLPLRSYMYQMN